MQDIKAALGGLARVQAMDVADDNHHYIVLSQLYAWMHAHALPAAHGVCLLYTSPSPRDRTRSRMPSSA